MSHAPDPARRRDKTPPDAHHHTTASPLTKSLFYGRDCTDKHGENVVQENIAMHEVLIGSFVTVAILIILRLVERRMGFVLIRGSMPPEDKLHELEQKIQHLTQKITVLETQADYLIETIIECRAALEREQSVKQYLSERVSVLQGYRNWNATQPNTTDTDPLPPELENGD